MRSSRRRARAGAAAALVLACTGSVRAQDAPDWRALCDARLPPGVVEATASALPVEFLSDETLAQLSSRIPHRPEERVLGVTQTHLNLAAGIRGMSLATPAGTCFRPSITIALKLRMQVRVAAEFPQGTCAHDAVLEHERRHVRANLEQLEVTRAWLQAELVRRHATDVVYGGSQREQVQRAEAQRQAWASLAKQKFAEVNLVHARIDSADEYRRTASLCDGQVARILRGGNP